MIVWPSLALLKILRVEVLLYSLFVYMCVCVCARMINCVVYPHPICSLLQYVYVCCVHTLIMCVVCVCVCVFYFVQGKRQFISDYSTKVYFVILKLLLSKLVTHKNN